MADNFSTFAVGLGSPYSDAAAVTPDNDTDLATLPRALYIGGAGSGNLSIITADGSTVAFAGLTANTILPIRAARVRATGTDVTAIVALY